MLFVYTSLDGHSQGAQLVFYPLVSTVYLAYVIDPAFTFCRYGRYEKGHARPDVGRFEGGSV